MKRLMIAVVLTATTVLAGCYSGPNYLQRSLDDAVDSLYHDYPLGSGIVNDVFYVGPFLGHLAQIGDMAILNPIQFWGSDIWTGQGAVTPRTFTDSEKSPFFVPDGGYDHSPW